MKNIITFYSTFFILSTYVAIFVVPLCYFLQRKNLINIKNSLFTVCALMTLAVFISVFNPQIEFLSFLSNYAFINEISTLFFHVRSFSWRSLSQIFGSEQNVYRSLFLFLLIVCSIGLSLYISSLLVILNKISRLKKIKMVGKVILLCEEQNITPHVFSIFGKSYVVVPQHVLDQKSVLRTAIQHEIQHIRNGDTYSIYLWQLLKCLLWINPTTHMILSYIKSLQELRVDENLIHDKKVNYKLYLKTLNWFICESRGQSRYSLSHSIFGWSTFREFKTRIKNIHRVRPMRSQPLICLGVVGINALILLLLCNSSPKFQYSLRDAERMYMPEYMKTEFILSVDSEYEVASDHVHTLEFGKERPISVPYFGPKSRDRIKKDGYEKINQWQKDNGSGRVVANAQLYSYHITAKVVEYGDTYVVVKMDGSYIDIDEIILNGAYKQVFAENKFKVAFGEIFHIEGVNADLKIVNKLVPKEAISFFPITEDQIAMNSKSP